MTKKASKLILALYLDCNAMGVLWALTCADLFRQLSWSYSWTLSVLLTLLLFPFNPPLAHTAAALLEDASNGEIYKQH